MNRYIRALIVAAALLLPAARPARAQVTVGGVVFSQYGVQLSDSAHHTNGFDVTRAYLNVTGKFAGGIATRLTPDLYRDANGSLSFRLKYAWFAWTPDKSPLTFRFGQITTPFIDWEEGMWGYRMQGPIAVDKFGYLTSADVGAGVNGSWSKDLVNAELTLSNGEGYKAAEVDDHKDAALRVSIRLAGTDDASARGGLRLTGYGHVGAKTGGGARDRLIGQLSYKSQIFLLAADYAHAKNGDPKVADVDSNVWSVFGTVGVPKTQVGAIARVDVYDPSTASAVDRQTHLILGASGKLGSNVLLLVDLDRLFYQGAAPSPAAAAQRSMLLFHTQFTF
jgi:hypothetical protein